MLPWEDPANISVHVACRQKKETGERRKAWIHDAGEEYWGSNLEYKGFNPGWEQSPFLTRAKSRPKLRDPR